MTTIAQSEALHHLAQLVDGIDIAMVVTRRADGTLESRPMATQAVDESTSSLWFFASRSSHFVETVRADGLVNVSYAHPGKHTYVSVVGEASVVDNERLRHALWRETYQLWFPGGVDDPDLILIRVAILSADYWDSPGNAVSRLMGFAKALFTNDRSDLGTQGHVEFPPGETPRT